MQLVTHGWHYFGRLLKLYRLCVLGYTFNLNEKQAKKKGMSFAYYYINQLHLP
jgi:hypothetical protein